jgi:uncharacterized protein
MMKYTIITGASSGIGKALALLYAKRGRHLILIARSIEVLEELKRSLEGLYSIQILVFKCDLTNLSEVNELCDTIQEHYAIECLINNAGVGLFERIGYINDDHLRIQELTNFVSPVLFMNAFIKSIDENAGSVINVGSILSFLPNASKSIYCGNKAALTSFSDCLRLEYPKVHVLTVHPITVKTKFFQEHYYEKQKQVLTPELVALQIMKAHDKKKRIVYVPKKIKMLKLVYLLFPNYIDRLNRKYYSNS